LKTDIRASLHAGRYSDVIGRCLCIRPASAPRITLY